MAVRFDSLEQHVAIHAPRSGPVTTASTAPSSQTSVTQTAEAPSFSAVFAQCAAAAAASGTTATGIAPESAAATGQAVSTPAGSNQQAASETDPQFGSDPWLADPTGSGPNGSVTQYNPIYFATSQTAQTVAQMLGGTVVESNQMVTAPGSPFTQDQPNYMVQLPDGAQVNPGLIADIYTHGWSQSLINQQVANEVSGAEAAVGG